MVNPAQRDALKVAAVYFVIGATWILGSDLLAERLFPTTTTALILNVSKGWLYVCITAMVTFWLVHRILRQRQRDYQQLLQTEARYLNQRNGLIALAGLRVQCVGDLPLVLREITVISANALGVARASIWLYDADHSNLVCSDLYELQQDRHSEGVTLRASDYPTYFRTLATNDVIDADNACTDPRTSEFAANYLTPLGITSMMDASIRLGGQLQGVVCHEHIGPQRQWTEDEKNFAVALGTQVSLALEGWQRCQAEAMLHQAQERMQRAVTASKVGLWEWDLPANELHYTPEAKRQLGYEDDEIGDGYEEWVGRIHPEDAERALRYATNYIGNPLGQYSQEFRLLHRDGSYRWILAQGSCEVDDQGQALRILGSHVDITERRQLEAQFQQAQKMESVGRLAGGVAHDFNNLLTVILGFAELASDDLDDRAMVERGLSEITDAAQRASNLTRQLLAFSRRQILQPEQVCLNDSIQSAEGMLRRLIGEDIDIVTHLGQGLGLVRADPGQIDQVIMNLVVNARDAMPNGGRLIITTRNAAVTAADRDLHPFSPPGQYVALEIADTGIGMDRETREKIFEPFFTTKEAGKGTGLGLAMVYGIVKQSGGAIECESEPGQGALFRILLPRLHGAVEEDTRHASVPISTAGTETVLVVEDQEGLRTVVQRFLEIAGYSVIAVASGNEALDLLQERQPHIDLLLTDVIMPGISGPELFRRLAARHPRLRVLYMSGYANPPVLEHDVLQTGAPLLTKPFTSAQLHHKVREVLGTPAAS